MLINNGFSQVSFNRNNMYSDKIAFTQGKLPINPKWVGGTSQHIVLTDPIKQKAESVLKTAEQEARSMWQRKYINSNPGVQPYIRINYQI